MILLFEFKELFGKPRVLNLILWPRVLLPHFALSLNHEGLFSLSLHFTIWLRVSNGDRFVNNVVLSIDIFEPLIIELPPIVNDDGIWNSKLINILFLTKYSPSLQLLGQRLSLNPIGEVIDGYDDELSLARDWGKGAEDIHFSLNEWSGSC